VEGEDAVLCYGPDGKERWRVTLGREAKGKHKNGSGSNPSPVTDGERLFVYFKSGRVAALDLEGKVLWQDNLQERYGKDTLWWDLGTSPVLAGGRVVIAVMQEGDSYLVAFDPASGDVVWKSDRSFVTKQESDQSYTTPLVVRQEGRDRIVTWGADHLTCHDAADGALVWTSAGFNPQDRGMWRTIASAAETNGVAVVPYGRGKYVAGIRLTGKGDITKENRLWEREDVGSDVPTPVAANGLVYVLGDEGELTCLAAETGKVVWSHKLEARGAKFYASPMLADNRLYCAREDGAVYVVQLGEGGVKEVAAGRLEDRLIASPVAVNRRLYLRGSEFLWCFGESQPGGR
jgi:outer membrane protein assembly factor BamB